MQNDLVSIIMPSHNNGQYVVETIRSVQAQTYQNWEIVFVDDASTDNTEEIVKALGEPRIRYFKNDTNRGAAHSRNKALREAKGRWIAFFDSDDLWEPEKLEHQIRFMEDHDYHFSYHDYIEIDFEGNERGRRISGKKHVNKFDMYACCWPGCLTVMYDAKVMGVIQIEEIAKNNDVAIWLKAIKKADCHLLKESLGRYRRRWGTVAPRKLNKKIQWYYRLFRENEKMSPLQASYWIFMNMVMQTIKKLFYIKRYTV